VLASDRVVVDEIFDGHSGAIASVPSVSGAGHLSHNSHETSWIVDLGADLGSPDWWRGMVTLMTLITCAVWIASFSPGTLEPEADPVSTLSPSPAAIGPLNEGAYPVGSARIGMTDAVRVLPATAEPALINKTIQLLRGDTLMESLMRAGSTGRDAYLAVESFSKVIDPRQVKAGQEFKIVLGPRPIREPSRTIQAMEVRSDWDEKVIVQRAADGNFAAKAQPMEIDIVPTRVRGLIKGGLFPSAKRSGAPSRAINDFMKVLGFTVDFQRDVRDGDEFDLVFNKKVVEETGESRTGELLYAKLRMKRGNKELELTKFAPTGEKAQFFHATGVSTKALLMKSPIDGARMTSGFGMRRHPILGFSRMHKGIDFAAPTGTPIMAAGTGIIEYIGRHAGYGNFIRIRHQGGFKTAYAHMSRFNPSVAHGKVVQQGQVIGYVGSTGLSTGPHLHYEIHKGNTPINPTSAKVPTGRWLEGSQLAAFKTQLNRMRSLRAVGEPEQLASLDKDRFAKN
jgi:murein DD-endopeptidase MepM/ murein hydrolase activator NlpD